MFQTIQNAKECMERPLTKGTNFFGLGTHMSPSPSPQMTVLRASCPSSPGTTCWCGARWTRTATWKPSSWTGGEGWCPATTSLSWSVRTSWSSTSPWSSAPAASPVRGRLLTMAGQLQSHRSGKMECPIL